LRDFFGSSSRRSEARSAFKSLTLVDSGKT
jgi:hypothetical protein